MVKVNNFGSYPSFDPPGSVQFDMLLTYVIKVDKREALSLYFMHIHMLLLYLVFPGKLPLAVKVNNFGSYPSFDSLDQAHLKCF